ncbi:MAG: hypothetical protein CM1200mP25_2760 [Acidobacteriota bacterium]|nr:MAG: hypothetical protein CM1200mP25_2760 [Acidobacteriota bacterium]
MIYMRGQKSDYDHWASLGETPGGRGMTCFPCLSGRKITNTVLMIFTVLVERCVLKRSVSVGENF